MKAYFGNFRGLFYIYQIGYMETHFTFLNMLLLFSTPAVPGFQMLYQFRYVFTCKHVWSFWKAIDLVKTLFDGFVMVSKLSCIFRNIKNCKR